MLSSTLFSSGVWRKTPRLVPDSSALLCWIINFWKLLGAPTRNIPAPTSQPTATQPANQSHPNPPPPANPPKKKVLVAMFLPCHQKHWPLPGKQSAGTFLCKRKIRWQCFSSSGITLTVLCSTTSVSSLRCAALCLLPISITLFII